jgi:alpha-tubulin suppressor-like RCC1 family protein
LRKSLLALLVFLLLVGPLLVPPKASAATGLTFNSVSSGLYATLALDNAGHIWAWGRNSGTFGDGTIVSSATPKRIDVMDGATPVAFREVKTQRLISMALDTTGHLWMTGEDSNNAQGNGAGRSDATAWTKLPVLDGAEDVTFTAIAAGFWNGFAIDSHGSIWGWGIHMSDTPVKQIITDGVSPVSFKGITGGNQAAIALDTSDRIWNLLTILPNTVKFDLVDGSSVPYQFKAISTGSGGDGGNVLTNYILHTALDSNGHIWTWGNNNSGQLGDGGASGAAGTVTPTLRDLKDGAVSAKFKSLSAGDEYVLTVDTAGDIWSWGSNANGQLGDGTTNNGSPKKLTVKDNNGNPVDFVSVYAGVNKSFAIDTNGRIWAWGFDAASVPTRLKFVPGATLSVSPASSSTKLQSVTLTAAVAGGLETPTGSVQFMDGATLLGSASLTGGTATYTVTSLAVRLHTLSVSYQGDSHYVAASSASVSHQVDMPAAPGLTLTPLTTSDTFDPVTVTVAASINGSGNSLSLLKWQAGSKTVSNFASAGTVITTPLKFDAASNGIYTVYAKDAAGNEVVKTIEVTNILQAGDPASLNAAILTAEQALTDHPAGTSVGHASASARNTLQYAIDASQLVEDDAEHRTQAQLDAATSTLNRAIATFNEAVIVAGDAATLNGAIATAEQALEKHLEGTDVGQAPESARHLLQTAIDAAQDVSDDVTNQTQAQLDAATSKLNGAIATFNEAVIVAGDPSGLNAAITTAEQTLADHPEGTGFGQASESARDALQFAIGEAQDVLDDATNHTQAQLDTATTTLNDSLATFNGLLIVAGDAAVLDAALAMAEQTLADHSEGTNVGQAPETVRDALQSAIDAAQDVSEDASHRSQAQLDAATMTLNGAIATFNEAVIVAGDAAALDAVIATAEQALADHPEGAELGQASESVRGVLQTAINEAQAILDDATNQTQAQLDLATATLNDAISAFGLTVVGVVLNVPGAGLYGVGDTLSFTLTYRDEVNVAGIPRLALALGANSVADTVYAEYTGATDVTTNSLTFEYLVPEGMFDEDGIALEGRLDLPNGAAVTLVAGGADALASFSVPETSGIRLIGEAPTLELSATGTPRTSADVTVTAAVYGEATAGNSLVQLNWLKGTHDVADFEGGAAGASIVVPKAFTVQTNGDYTVYAQDAAGNESVAVITIASIISITYPVSTPSSSGTTVELSPDGGVVVRVADSDIKKETQQDGTVTESFELTDLLMDQILEHLKKAGKPTVTLVIDDTEQAVNVRFPAVRLGAQLAAYPNLQYEVRLNDSSFLLQVNVLDLADLASRLGVDLKDLKVSILTSQVVGTAKAELERLADTKGMKLIGQAVDYRIMVTGGGRSIEVTDFGGTYMARAIVMESIEPDKSYTAVVYDPSVPSLSFVPAVLGTRSDDKQQMSMSSPHNSIYAIMETTKRSFDDLNGHWAKEEVELLASKLIVQGISDTKFSPGGSVKRAEFLTLLVRALGIRTDADPADLSFVDVPSSAWYAPEVAAGVKAGLAKGLDADHFDPNGTVTREQMAVMLDNALALAEGRNSESAAVSGPVDFVDANRISSWARAAIERIAEEGIVQGTADGRFEPQANATRAEAAAMLKRFLLTVKFIDG